MNSSIRCYVSTIGLVSSPLCTFCKKKCESLTYPFIKCDFSDSFWRKFINWCNTIGVKVEVLTEVDNMFGDLEQKNRLTTAQSSCDFSKTQHIYFCLNKGILPSLNLFFKTQSNLSLRATLGTEEGGLCKQVAVTGR